jgi:nitroimidazol reductase NimA-like FMN-containing flavoprotein (pyridoxamine 5'-phosphate oxidase superfamily)
MSDFTKTTRNQVKRIPKRGHYDKETIYDIIDQALICHVSFVVEGQPFVIPTLHARQGDNLLLHGARTSRMIKHLQAGQAACINITLVDGLVLARSVFHHSINYRSVVLFGKGHLVADEDKMEALELFTERIMPGRWDDARQPNPQEFKATSVVAIPMESASAKVRVGPPGDDEEDYELPIWAGVVPLRQQVGTPQADPLLRDGIPLPDYITSYVKGRELMREG